MKNFAKRGLALIMALVMCVSLLPGIGVSVSAASYIYNWGQRGEVATELSDNARAFYEDYDVTYDELAALSGSSSISGVPSSALYKKLQSLMTDAQHTVTSYADTRTMFQYTDCQNGGGTISSFYSGKEIGPAWDGGSTWNREHTWPNSKGDASGDGENDIMMLRPTSVSENSSRGNKAYGESSGYYFPNGTSGGTYDLRGDVSRIMLFVYVRWGNTVNMWGESGVIESKEVLLNWMEEDPVDTWELGRNDAVESITGTRNVFVDYPELAFELFDADVPAEMVTPSASDRAKDYTVTATSSNESYGTVSVEGHTITATVVKNGYTVGGYKVTSGIADVERSGNVFTVYPKSNCTVQITFRKLQEMTMTFTDAAGNAAAEEICELEGTAVILPDYAGAAYTTHAFVGWVENAVTDTANEPTSLKAGGEYILTNDTQLLALYSYTTGGVTYYTTSVGCVHENTSRTGAKDATCIAAGYTGDTVCTDCGQTLQTGETIAMTGHNYVDGTCSSCGGAEPLDYVLVTDVGQLSAGASVVIVAAEADYALSTNQKSNNRGATAITKSGDILEITDDVAELTLEAGSQPDTWAFYTGSGYLYAASSSSNHLKTQTSLNENGCWIITVTDGVASVVAQGSNTRATMQYNPNNGAPLFSCYTGATQGALALYVKGGAASGCDHSVTTVTGAKDATCTAPGYTGDTVCTACGATLSVGSTVSATGHSYVGGVCSSCGAVEPTVDPNAPAVNTAYYMVMDKQGTVLYFNGQTESESVAYRLATTTDAAQAVPVYLETAPGGYYLYFMNGGAKTYIRVYQRTSGEAGKGKGSLELVNATPDTVLTYDAAAKTLVYIYNSNNAYYMGTYDSYTTFSVSNTSYITGENAGNVDISQFPARFILADNVEICEHATTTTTTQDATCTADGSITVTCDDCGATVSTTVIEAIGHNFVDGICSCGATESTGGTLTSGNYIITCSNGVILGEYDNGSSPWITEGDNSSVWTVVVTGDTATLCDVNGTYIAPKAANTNGISAGEYDWTVIDNGDGTYSFAGDSVKLAYNGDSRYLKFRAYKDSTINGGSDKYPCAFTLTALGGEICEHTDRTTVETQDATCTAAGYIKETCNDCGQEFTEDIAPLGHSFAEGVCSVCGATQPVLVTAPQAGTAYKWGIQQDNLNKTIFFSGAMAGYYGATTDVGADGVDVYLENAQGGYYVTFIDAEGAKKYVNVVQNGTYTNFTIADSAVTVYTYDTEHNTLTAVLGETTYYIGTYGTYNTFSVSAISKIGSSFPAQFYTLPAAEDPFDPEAFAAAAPVVAAEFEAASGTVKLTWEAVEDATYYEIYRATSKSGTYTLAQTTESTECTVETEAGKTRYYKVKAVYEKDDVSVDSLRSEAVKAVFKCAIPAVTVQNNEENGRVQLTWEKVAGAKKYDVYRATSENGKYSKLTTTSKTYYTDSKGSVGREYFYKVRAVASSSSYNSAYSAIVSGTRICAQVDVSFKLDGATGKPILSWDEVSGAASYRILRQLPGENALAEIAVVDDDRYTDTTAPVDTQCIYQVQAMGANEALDGAVSEAVAIAAGLARPQLEGILTSTGRPSISWEAVEGAQSYIIYRSTKSSKSYKQIDETAELSFIDEEASGGKAYYYKVVAVGANSESAISSYKKVTGKCMAPVVSAENNEESGRVRLSWEKVSGAKKYYVYRATSLDGKYTKLTSTTKTYYTDSKGTLGTEYFYKVVAVASSSKYNSYDSNIVSGMRVCARPEVKVTVDKYTGNLTISCDKVSGAGDYTVYCSQNGGEFVELFTGSGTKFTDDSVVAGNRYQYAVQAVVDGNEALSSAMGISKEVLATCARPSITGTRSDAGKPQISWEADEEAERYVIYRSTKSSSGYKFLGETETLSYTDETAKAGKTYYYKVVAVAGESESYMSSYVKIKSK